MEDSPRQIQLSRQSSETILIVDDEEQIRSLMEDTLDMFGYRVITAKDGREAVELYQQHNQIDLVILDIIMPVLDGVQTYRAMMKMNPKAKIIFITGYAGGKLDLSGRFYLLSKPFLPTELLKVVRKALDAPL
ncbi:response regulator [Geomesophilobacter sediminis]|uniref:Response regulator n=1 Tax=Geomesophilobacter sediminis TaxID=2798584 RepID=A0A8J7IMS0_9BACT|nr:response regulator [Geomesophilobacter sediminis]MBJ6724173.1 response regulator [Geomesophilobacter sediminis]